MMPEGPLLFAHGDDPDHKQPQENDADNDRVGGCRREVPYGPDSLTTRSFRRGESFGTPSHHRNR